MVAPHHGLASTWDTNTSPSGKVGLYTSYLGKQPPQQKTALLCMCLSGSCSKPGNPPRLKLTHI